MIRILVADPLSPKAIDQLNEIAEFEVIEKTGLNESELKEEIRNVEAVVVRSVTRLTREMIENGPKLKIIVRVGIGLDNVDVDYARIRNIAVRTTPCATSITVAEYTLALMLAVSRFLGPAYRSMKEHKWQRDSFAGGCELFDRTAGIIGFGRSGQEVARRELGMGMKVVYHDIEEIRNELNAQPVSLEHLLKVSDYISLHLPLDDRTKRMISDREFGMMKRNAIVINVSSGGIIDEAALLRAVKEERIRGAAIDVFEKEPPDRFELIDHERIFPVPHLGAASDEGQERAAVNAISILKEFFNV